MYLNTMPFVFIVRQRGGEFFQRRLLAEGALFAATVA